MVVQSETAHGMTFPRGTLPPRTRRPMATAGWYMGKTFDICETMICNDCWKVNAQPSWMSS